MLKSPPLHTGCGLPGTAQQGNQVASAPQPQGWRPPCHDLLQVVPASLWTRGRKRKSQPHCTGSGQPAAYGRAAAGKRSMHTTAGGRRAPSIEKPGHTLDMQATLCSRTRAGARHRSHVPRAWSRDGQVDGRLTRGRALALRQALVHVGSEVLQECALLGRQPLRAGNRVGAGNCARGSPQQCRPGGPPALLPRL